MGLASLTSRFYWIRIMTVAFRNSTFKVLRVFFFFDGYLLDFYKYIIYVREEMYKLSSRDESREIIQFF